MYTNQKSPALPSRPIPASPVRILIADDSELVRSKLEATLSTRDDWIVCSQAADGREAVMLAVEQKPDFIILDFSMPMLSGIQATAEILKVMPRVPIVLYTLYDDPHTEAEAKKVGIRKVISKTKSDLVADLAEILGKPHNIGPLGVSDAYAIEPVRGEEAAAAEPTKPARKRG
jgi:DNA-binding NarL/FixJ family response regulator